MLSHQHQRAQSHQQHIHDPQVGPPIYPAAYSGTGKGSQQHKEQGGDKIAYSSACDHAVEGMNSRSDIAVEHKKSGKGGLDFVFFPVGQRGVDYGWWAACANGRVDATGEKSCDIAPDDRRVDGFWFDDQVENTDADQKQPQDAVDHNRISLFEQDRADKDPGNGANEEGQDFAPVEKFTELVRHGRGNDQAAEDGQGDGKFDIHDQA